MSLADARLSGAGTTCPPLAGPAAGADTAATVHVAPVPPQWCRGANPDDRADFPAAADVGVRLAATHVEVTLAGELDLAIAPAITGTVRDLRAAGHNHVIVNLDAVTFMDGTILGVLVAAHRDVTAAGGSLGLTAHPLCDRLLRVTGMTGVFTAATG